MDEVSQIYIMLRFSKFQMTETLRQSVTARSQVPRCGDYEPIPPERDQASHVSSRTDYLCVVVRMANSGSIGLRRNPMLRLNLFPQHLRLRMSNRSQPWKVGMKTGHCWRARRTIWSSSTLCASAKLAAEQGLQDLLTES